MRSSFVVTTKSLIISYSPDSVLFKIALFLLLLPLLPSFFLFLLFLYRWSRDPCEHYNWIYRLIYFVWTMGLKKRYLEIDCADLLWRIWDTIFRWYCNHRQKFSDPIQLLSAPRTFDLVLSEYCSSSCFSLVEQSLI